MQTWIIRQTHAEDTYFIPTKKTIWITEEGKGADITQLIADKKLSVVKGINYEDLRRILFIETDYSISFEYKDEKTKADTFQVEPLIFREILSYFKANLRGVEVKKITAIQQIIPHLITFVMATALTVGTYISAVQLEQGETIRISGRRAWLKEIMVKIAEVLGTTGTIIVGALILGFILYTIYQDFQNPKKGEMLIVKKFPEIKQQ